MKITLPDGFQIPATAKPGEPFEVTATLMMGEGGTMLTALDGVALMEEEEEEEEEEGMEEEMGGMEEEYADPQILLPFENA
jgi:hypothetical protein